MENENKVTVPQKIAMDGGRVVLSVMIPFYRVKRYYLDGENGQETIKNLGGAIIAANHQSFADPLILNASFWYRRFFYTAGEAILTGVKGFLLQKAGCIKIDRTKLDMGAINRCEEVLKEGYLLGFFPQGTIAGGAAHGGMAMIAAMADVPIVPTYIKLRKNVAGRHEVVYGRPFKISDYAVKKLPNKAELEKIINVYEEQMLECKALVDKE